MSDLLLRAMMGQRGELRATNPWLGGSKLTNALLANVHDDYSFRRQSSSDRLKTLMAGALAGGLMQGFGNSQVNRDIASIREGDPEKMSYRAKPLYDRELELKERLAEESQRLHAQKGQSLAQEAYYKPQLRPVADPKNSSNVTLGQYVPGHGMVQVPGAGSTPKHREANRSVIQNFIPSEVIEKNLGPDILPFEGKQPTKDQVKNANEVSGVMLPMFSSIQGARDLYQSGVEETDLTGEGAQALAQHLANIKSTMITLEKRGANFTKNEEKIVDSMMSATSGDNFGRALVRKAFGYDPEQGLAILENSIKEKVKGALRQNSTKLNPESEVVQKFFPEGTALFPTAPTAPTANDNEWEDVN